MLLHANSRLDVGFLTARTESRVDQQETALWSRMSDVFVSAIDFTSGNRLVLNNMLTSVLLRNKARRLHLGCAASPGC